MDKNKVRIILTITCLLVFVIGGWTLALRQFVSATPIESHQLIRLHVIANSDTNQDQSLKLKVRDNIIVYLNPYMSDVNDIGEARKMIYSKQQDIEKIAKNTIAAAGSNDSVRVEIGYYKFPIKSYGELVLPAGEYEAVRVLIGDAQGKNWWCVLFPPLCFVDATNACSSAASSDASVIENVELKWKIVEIFQ